MRTRQYILEAVERILQTKGLARLTTKEIALEAGCAEGTIYKHFQSKEELVLSAVAENLPDILALLEPQRAGQHPLETNLQNIAKTVINYYEKLIPRSAFLFADIELLGRFREWMQEQKAGPLKLFEPIVSYIEAEQELGRLNQTVQPFYFASLLLGSCFQYVFIRCFQGNDPYPVTEQQFIAGLVQTLLQNNTSLENGGQ